VIPEIEILAKLLEHNWVTNNTMVQWKRLQTDMEWFPHPLQTYTR
jgi:hypothetical protein